MNKKEKKLCFELTASQAEKKAKASLDHSLMSGKAAKISDFEVLKELVKLLDDKKFDNYDIEFVRFDKLPDGKSAKTEMDMENIKTALKHGIELRPTS